MNLLKCPRCELNYIREDEKYCKVCYRDIKGEQTADEIELCSICNESPALPGKDMCLMCLKEMSVGGRNVETDIDDPVEDSALSIDPVSTMDEIIPDINEDIPDNEYGEIANELSSIESIRDDEEESDADEEEDDS